MSDDGRAERALHRLNRILLWLLMTELAYLLLWVLVCAVVWILESLFPAGLVGAGWGSLRSIITPGVLRPFQIAFVGNLVGAFCSLALYIRCREVPVGFFIGHILNWIYVASTGWLYLFVFLQTAFGTLGRAID